MIPPSGEQFELRHGAHRVTVVEVGGGIREWEGVIDGYPLAEMAKSARGAVLMPWPNRLAEGRYEFDGVAYHVPIDEPPHAMHGLVRWASWRPVAVADTSVELEHVLHPSPVAGSGTGVSRSSQLRLLLDRRFDRAQLVSIAFVDVRFS